MRAKNIPASDHYGLTFFCPGCKTSHHIPTKPHERGWDFNGDYDKPTLSPSILVYPHDTLAEDDVTVIQTPRCHSYVREGRIEFLADCTHELVGQTVDLPELEP